LNKFKNYILLLENIYNNFDIIDTDLLKNNIKLIKIDVFDIIKKSKNDLLINKNIFENESPIKLFEKIKNKFKVQEVNIEHNYKKDYS